MPSALEGRGREPAPAQWRQLSGSQRHHLAQILTLDSLEKLTGRILMKKMIVLTRSAESQVRNIGKYYCTLFVTLYIILSKL